MTEQAALQTGLTHSESFCVQPRHRVSAVDPDWPGFSDMPGVLATAYMIGFMEQTCIQALRPFLAPGEHTVGTGVNVTHVAATQPGQNVTARVELREIDGRALVFQVACYDEYGLIGEGVHRRAIINVARFTQRLETRTLS